MLRYLIFLLVAINYMYSADAASSQFVALKFANIVTYAGSDVSYPEKYRYPYLGTPLIALKEFGKWTKIRDWEGKESWVKSRFIDTNHRAFIVKGRINFTPVYRFADDKSDVVALLRDNVMGDIVKCTEEFCIIKSSDIGGWISINDIFGDTSEG